MELNNNSNNTFSNDISSFTDELNTFLENTLEGATFTVDKIEGEIATCENRQTRKMINLSLSLLPKNIHESDIIKFINGKFILDAEETMSSKKRINEKFNNLLKK